MSNLLTTNFTADTVGTLPSGWTATAGTWAVGTNHPVDGGTHSLENTSAAADSRCIRTGMTANADHRISLAFKNVGNGQSYECFVRSDDAGNNAYLFTCNIASGFYLLNIYILSGGSSFGSIAVTPAIAATVGDTVRLECVAHGDAIEARIWLNGATRPALPLMRVIDTTYTTGKVGVRYDTTAFTSAIGFGTVSIDTIDATTSLSGPYAYARLRVTAAQSGAQWAASQAAMLTSANANIACSSVTATQPSTDSDPPILADGAGAAGFANQNSTPLDVIYALTTPTADVSKLRVAEHPSAATSTVMKDGAFFIGVDGLNWLQVLTITGDTPSTYTGSFGGHPSKVFTLTTPSALAAGTASAGTAGVTTWSPTATEATGGTPTYTKQWYVSTTNGFTPGGGNLVSGATSLTPTITGLTAATVYYARLIYTDSAGSPATATSNQITITTAAAAATATTLSGPTTGAVGVPSSNFTIGANGGISGSIVVTPNDSSGGGTFSPTSVTLTSGSPTATVTYTAATSGTKTIGTTNASSLTNPSTIAFVATTGGSVPTWRSTMTTVWKKLSTNFSSVASTTGGTGIGPLALANFNHWVSMGWKNNVGYLPWPGGHADGSWNGVMVLNLLANAPQWAQVIAASLDTARNMDSDGFYTDGRPASSHNYNLIEYCKANDKVYRLGSTTVFGNGSSGSGLIASFTVSSLALDAKDPALAMPSSVGREVPVCPINDHEFLAIGQESSYSKSFIFNATTGVVSAYPWSIHQLSAPAAYDPVRDRVLIISARDPAHSYTQGHVLWDMAKMRAGNSADDPSNGFASVVTLGGIDRDNPPWGNDGLANGIDYDPDGARFLITSEHVPDTVWAINAITFAVSTVTTNDSGVAVAPPGEGGLHRKFKYLPDLGGVIMIHGGDEVWFAALKDITGVPISSLTVTATLPDGAVGTPYTGGGVTATGGTGAITYSVGSGSLPAGLSLNASTGAITGTPTTAATSTGIIFHAHDSTSSTPIVGDSSTHSVTIAPSGGGGGGGGSATVVEVDLAVIAALQSGCIVEVVLKRSDGGLGPLLFDLGRSGATSPATFTTPATSGSPLRVAAMIPVPAGVTTVPIGTNNLRVLIYSGSGTSGFFSKPDLLGSGIA